MCFIYLEREKEERNGGINNFAFKPREEHPMNGNDFKVPQLWETIKKKNVGEV